MKNLLSFILLVILSLTATAQSVQQADVIIAKQKLTVAGTPVTGVSNDTAFVSPSQSTIPSQYAVYWYITHHAGSGGGGSVAWSAITGKPTTIAGYGLTDAYSTSNPSAFISAADGNNLYYPLTGNPSGYTTQTASDARYVLANGTYANPSWLTSIPFSKITSTPTSLAQYGITDGVSVNSLYYNPSWMQTLAFSKLTGTPTTLSGYGITDIPSQSGNNGKVLGTNGSAMSWVSASGGGGATQPQALGTIFATNTWASTSNWTANGATPSVSGGKLVVTYSSGNVPSADYNYYTMLEKWNFFARIVATSTSAKIGIGIHSTNVYEGFSLYAQVDASTGYLTLTSTDLYGGTFTPTIQATSIGHLTINANDKIVINLERDVDSVYCYALDATTQAGWVNCSFAYNTNGTNQGTPNTGRFAFVANAGAFTVDSMGISSNELKNANMYVTSDSKGTYVANGFNSRWPQKLANFFYPSVVAIGGSEGVRDVINRLPEIVALAPKYVLLCIGRNDVAHAYSGLNTDYQTITTTLTSAGISVIHMNQIYESYGISLSSLSNFISSTYPTTYIDTYTPSSQLGASGNFGDQIHPLQSEHDIVYNTVIQSRKIPTIFDWRSMVRFNIPAPVLKLDNFGGNQYIGWNSGNDTSTQGANGNYAWGNGALASISSGTGNFALGTWAGHGETIGNYNIHIGDHAGYKNWGSTESIYIGHNSGIGSLYPPFYASTDNIFIGARAGNYYGYNGSHNIYIGNRVGNSSGTQSNVLDIGGGYDWQGNSHDLIFGDLANGRVRIGVDAATTFADGTTGSGFSPGVSLELTNGLRLGKNATGFTPYEGSFYYDYTNHTFNWYNGSAYTNNVLTKQILTPAAASTAVCHPNTFTILNPASALSSMTLQLFAGSYAYDNAVVEFVAEKTISGVTYYVADGGGAAGQCINCPTTFTPGVHYKVVYNSADGNWY